MKIHAQNMPYAPIVLLPCGAGTEYKVGQALNVVDGAAVLCTGDAEPIYVCHSTKTGAIGEEVEAVRITRDMVLEATLQSASSGLKIGNGVKLHTDGEKVLPSVTGKLFVTGLPEGTGAGAKVLVRV